MAQQPVSKERVLIVVPAFNEQGKIGRVVHKIPRDACDGIVVVNDCSTDGTAAEAEQAGAILITHSKRRGVGAAIRSGIDYAIANQYDVVAVLSGDDQHDPNDLYGLLAPILDGKFDFVQGSRRLIGLQSPQINTFRRISTWWYTALFRLLTGFPCTDATNGGRAFRTRILSNKQINLWQDWLNTYELEPYLLYKAIKCSVRTTEAPMKVIYHNKGTTKMRPVKDWWRLFRPLLFLACGLRH
jgi:dolichol-phosphate mannosyltransferase